MKISASVLDMMDGKGLHEQIYAFFPMPPIQEIEIRPNVIFRLCAEKKVIHLGCTDHLPLIDARIRGGTYFHRQLTCVASACIGVDINTEAVNHLYKQGIRNVISADITLPGIKAIENENWDYMVIPDVLEHIPNPASFLSSIAEVYGSNVSRFIISVPNAYGNAMQAKEHYGQEVINYDHCFWFSPYTLCKVIKASGLVPDEIFMCSYENPTDMILKRSELYKQYPLLLNTIILTAYIPQGG
jgi:hypothetical protein